MCRSTLKTKSSDWVFVAILSCLSSLSLATPVLERQQLAIRNGDLTPHNIPLSLEQEKAIGWLYTQSLGRPFCTATVISDDTILTARHCFYGTVNFPPNTTFEFHLLSDEGRALQREEGAALNDSVFSSEDRFPFSFANVRSSANYDIVIVQFPNRPFARPGLRAIPINITPIDGDFSANLTGSMVDVAGYGGTLHQNERGRYFASVKVEVITPTYIITDGLNEQGVCNGDSGGPILAAGIDGEVSVIAVVSNGDPCCIGLDQHTRVDLERDGLLRGANFYSSNPNLYPPACWGLYKNFRCDRIGDKELLNFCYEGQVERIDCRDEGKFCAFDEVDRRFECLSQDLSHPCVDIPSGGRCENSNTILRCEYGTRRRLSCVNATCGLIADGERVACISQLQEDQVLCEEGKETRLEISSEAKFSTTSGCNVGIFAHSNHIFELLILLLGLGFTMTISKRHEDP